MQICDEKGMLRLHCAERHSANSKPDFTGSPKGDALERRKEISCTKKADLTENGIKILSRSIRPTYLAFYFSRQVTYTVSDTYLMVRGRYSLKGCEKCLPGPAGLLLNKTGSFFSASLYNKQ